ncbi:DUF3696 domain-containing protein [uncultured Pseudoteredinibacter sp.]|uniref:AAA family ATPase n=1 Tax=uncultured Pseudoteredinibacter sp. TaxID=1641701 RepID=UPI0026364D19|nr:DUF3696 domain-containing protein [uncultured Pseudoteredinibacter sp.]
MLDGLMVENFKCLKRQFVPLSPLTLLTGFNAAGKSTAIQSVLLGSQMARTGSGCTGVPLNGDLVKLGSVGDVLCQFADEREVRFEYSAACSKSRVKLDASERSKTSLLVKPGSSLQEDSTINSILRNVINISATRIGTLDVFPSPENLEPVFADVGESGQFAPWWFDQHSDEDVCKEKAHPSEKALILRRQFSAWANEIFPGSEANTVNIERTPLVRLELRTGLQDQWKRPANIGYGLTYAFPILVAGLLAKKGQILIIDSPEAHLHPRGQSKIGFFLGAMAAAGVQVLIETHSDHVLNGVRLAVAKNVVPKGDVSIHFFSSSSDDFDPSAVVTSPIIDSEGNLSEWPEGFFDQSDKDLAALSGWG